MLGRTAKLVNQLTQLTHTTKRCPVRGVCNKTDTSGAKRVSAGKKTEKPYNPYEKEHIGSCLLGHIPNPNSLDGFDVKQLDFTRETQDEDHLSLVHELPYSN